MYSLRDILSFIIGFLVGFIGTFLVLDHAFGHSWYDTYCCNTKDCAPIPNSSVVATDTGWVVTLKPGEHPMVDNSTGPLVFHAPYEKTGLYQAVVRDSKDDGFHACLQRAFDTIHLRCFYTPPMGF